MPKFDNFIIVNCWCWIQLEWVLVSCNGDELGPIINFLHFEDIVERNSIKYWLANERAIQFMALDVDTPFSEIHSKWLYCVKLSINYWIQS